MSAPVSRPDITIPEEAAKIAEMCQRLAQRAASIGWAEIVYWNGSSTASPSLEDFAAPGFRMVCTFEAVPS